MKRFSISDIENLTGIKAHTIRIWEQRYGLVVPKRTATNIRYYDDMDLGLLLNIAALNEYGYKISRIAVMSHQEILGLVSELKEDHSNFCIQVQMLANAMLALDEREFVSILDGCIQEMGLEKTMEEALFPFMKKIGLMWLARAIKPSHEHFASNIIAQRLIVEISKQQCKIIPSPKRFLLFLPQGEIHYIGLLFARYMIQMEGHEVLYLGANTPFEDIQPIINQYDPHYLLTVLTTLKINNDVNKVIAKLLEVFHEKPLLVAGTLVTDNEILSDPRLLVIKQVPDLAVFLSNLAPAYHERVNLSLEKSF